MQQFIIYTKFYCCFGRPWSLEALITKLTLTVALTLTDTVTVTSMIAAVFAQLICWRVVTCTHQPITERCVYNKSVAQLHNVVYIILM